MPSLYSTRFKGIENEDTHFVVTNVTTVRRTRRMNESHKAEEATRLDCRIEQGATHPY